METFGNGSVKYSDNCQIAIPPEELPQLKDGCSAVCGAEIGGLNSTEPLAISAAFNVPCLDADGMGRAFPELQVKRLGFPTGEKGMAISISWWRRASLQVYHLGGPSTERLMYVMLFYLNSVQEAWLPILILLPILYVAK